MLGAEFVRGRVCQEPSLLGAEMSRNRNITATSKFAGFRWNILFQHAKTGGIRGFRHLVVLKL